MWAVIGDGIGKHQARTRNGLETAGTPTAIYIEPFNVRL